MFKMLLLDIDGVIIDSNKSIITPSIAALKILVELRIPFLFISNNVRHSSKSLNNLFFQHELHCNPIVINPHFILRDQLMIKKIPSGSVFLSICDETTNDFLIENGYKRCLDYSVQTIDFILIGSTININYHDLALIVNNIYHNAVPIFAIGLEAVFFWDGIAWPSSGSLISLIKYATKRDPIILGKPSDLLFQYVKKNWALDDGIWVIGDDINTDIKGGKNASINTALMMSGITDYQMLSSSEIKPDIVSNDLNDFVVNHFLKSK